MSFKTNRYVSAGVWVNFQRKIQAIVKILLFLGVILVPATAVFAVLFVPVKTVVVVVFGAMAFSVIMSLWLFLVDLFVEQLRINGLPVVEQ